MKTKSIIALFIVFVLLLTGCAAKTGDFRDANWGDSAAIVDRDEKTAYSYADDVVVIYNDSYEDQPIEIYYMFVDNKLTEAKMQFITGDRILEEVIEAYYLMEQNLTELYGDPVNGDREIWLDENSAYKNDKPQVAIYQNDLIYKTEWETETTYAYLILECIDKRHIEYHYYACEISLKP